MGLGQLIGPMRVIASGRLWFALAALAVLLPWHESRVERFGREEGAALEGLKASASDALGDYFGIENRIQNIRARAARDTSWQNLRRMALDDVAAIVTSPAIPVSQQDAWREALISLRASVEGKGLAAQIASDSSRIRQLNSIMNSGRQRRRMFTIELVAILLGTGVAALGYRGSSRSRWLAHQVSALASKRLDGVRGWWADWDGTWLGLNRPQRAALCLIALFLFVGLVLFQWNGYLDGSLRGQGVAVWGIVVPAGLVAAVLMMVLATPGGRS